MSEKSFFYTPEHKRHEGMTDAEGRQWDVPARLKSIVRCISQEHDITRFNIIRETTESEILPFLDRVHSTEMVEAIKQASQDAIDGAVAITPFDSDQQSSVTTISASTYKVALSAVKCALAAAESLHDNSSKLSAALTRPPGHHAGRNFYHGFCYFNNIAVAAEALKSAGKKVAILDIDVHHGDGTQDIFYEDDKVYYTSLHADPNHVLPHTGKSDDLGRGQGMGTTLNLPYPIGVSVDEYLSLLNLSLKHIDMYGPDYMLISAGFDTHRREYDNLNLPPITQLDTQDYTEIGSMIGSLSLPSGVVLEGGYNQDTLGPSFSNLVHGLEEKLKTKASFEFYATDAAR